MPQTTRVAIGVLLALGQLAAPDAGRAQPAAAAWPERPVVASTVVADGGGRLDWAAQGDRLVFDRIDAARGDGLFDLWVLDLATGAERCLTCAVFEFRGAHALDPAWHPSGEYVVFQAQRNARKLGLGVVELAGAARGLHGDLWLVRADGKDLWQLTRAADMGSAVLTPHFSHEGDTLLWSERTTSRPPPWGGWQLRTARLQIQRGVPRLKGLEGHRPEGLAGLVLAEGFLPDDQRFLLAAERAPGGALDLAIWDPRAKRLERLTASGAGDDAYPRISPRGDFLAWVADAAGRRGPSDPTGALPAREVWTMSLDGADRRPLTRFNGEGTEGLGRAWVGDLAWSPRGDRLAVQVIHGAAEPRAAIVVLELDPDLRRADR
jgi:Tol biopolymer transport system component